MILKGTRRWVRVMVAWRSLDICKTKTINQLWVLYKLSPWVLFIRLTNCVQNLSRATSLVVQWLRLCALNAEGPGSILSQGTRSHMPQLSLHATTKSLHAATKEFFCMPQLKRSCMLRWRSKISSATTKTWSNQINILKRKKYESTLL